MQCGKSANRTVRRSRIWYQPGAELFHPSSLLSFPIFLHNNLVDFTIVSGHSKMCSSTNDVNVLKLNPICADWGKNMLNKHRMSKNYDNAPYIYWRRELNPRQCFCTSPFSHCYFVQTQHLQIGIEAVCRGVVVKILRVYISHEITVL